MRCAAPSKVTGRHTFRTSKALRRSPADRLPGGVDTFPKGLKARQSSFFIAISFAQMPRREFFPTGFFSAEELFNSSYFFMSNQRVLLCAAELDDIGPASVGA